MTQHKPPPQRQRVNNTSRQAVRIHDEATRRAWALLWPDVPDEPQQGELLDPAAPSKSPPVRG